jgi:hypothetical protein
VGKKVFSNNALSTLASSISSVASSCSATSGGGSLFPALTPGNSFQMTFSKIVGGAVTAQEIVTVTARTGDVFTITRGQESTTALSWNAGDTMEQLPTAADLASFSQAVDLQAQAGNYATDTGTANAYVASVTPPLAAHSVGTPIVWKASNNNTGPSTFSDGFGVGNLLTTNLQTLLPGNIRTGGIYESVWDGTQFQLLNPTLLAYLAAYKLSATGRITSAFLPDPDLQFTLAANTSYKIKAFCPISGGVGGFRMGFGFTGTMADNNQVGYSLRSSSSFIMPQGNINFILYNNGSINAADFLMAEGSLTTTSIGVLSVSWGQNTTNAATSTLSAGAYLTADLV